MANTRKSNRVFMGMTDIAGYYTQLEKGFAALGVLVTKYGKNRFDYKNALPTPAIVKWAYEVESRFQAAKKPLAVLWWREMWRLTRLVLLFWAVLRHDAFVFAAGTSFFSLHELPLLKALGKKLIFVFHGSDSRPIFVDGALQQLFPEPSAQVGWVQQRTKMLARIEKYADWIALLPSSAHWHQRPIVNWLFLGLPYSLPSVPPAQASTLGNKVRILHSPSNPQAKGTPIIRETIQRLQARGLPIEWVEVINLPNEVVLQELQRCDLVIDQLYSDTAMAGFACEAAFFGKPAVVGTYASPADWAVPAELIPPTAYCHPSELESTIERLVLDEGYRKELGQKAQSYVREKWDATEVAKRFLRLIEGDVPSEWMFDPRSISYLGGWALSAEAAQKSVRQLVTHAGPQALALQDKPQLLQRFLQWAGLNHDSQTPG